MTATCEKCGKRYDDTYRLTYCPHDRFEMNTTVGVGGRVIGVAHSVEELNRMLEEAKR
jgi:hypothetical protein